MCDTSSAKKDIIAEILENTQIADGFYRMTLAVKDAENDFATGQFFQIKINPGCLDPLLRRPFAPSFVDSGSMSFVYAVVGRGTEDMTRLIKGDKVGLLYPLGRGFTLPTEKSDCILVGGGCGAPSMLALAVKLKKLGHSVHIALGAKNKCSLLEREAMAETSDTLVVATDDGSDGLHGHSVMAAEKIIDGLSSETPKMIYACGPLPMLKGTHALSDRTGICCEVSLEERMGCGFGACVGCVVKIRDESRDEGFVYKKVCLDGPVFDSKDIVW